MTRPHRLRHPGVRPIGAYNVLRALEQAQPAAIRAPANTNHAHGSKSVVTRFRRVALEIPRPRHLMSPPTAPKIAPQSAPVPEAARPTPLAAVSALLLQPPPPAPVRPATVLQWQFRPQSRRQELVLVPR